MIQLQDFIFDGFGLGLSSQEWYLGSYSITVRKFSIPGATQAVRNIPKAKSVFGSTWTAYGPSIRDAAMQFFLGTDQKLKPPEFKL